MVKHGVTRERVVRAAADLFQQQGYSATGLNQVVDLSGAPKGSLYFHFPEGKQQLAVEAVTLAGAELGEAMAQVVARADGVHAAIIAVAELFATALEDTGYRAGCPVATVALEVSGNSESIREACDLTYSTWLGGLADYFAHQGIGHPESMANLVVSAIQGALLLAKVQRDATILRTTAMKVADLAAAAATEGAK